MKYLILFLLAFQTFVFPDVFQLATIVDNHQLIPVIKINGKIVIKVKDVGTKQVFSSSFERSEKIYESLQEMGDQRTNLNRIRIRRNKADYVAYIDNIEVYRVTPSDVIGSDLTVYQMASLWRDNIVSAIKITNFSSSTEIDEQQSQFFSDFSMPLISFLSIFSNNSIFVVFFQFMLFIIIQVVAILLTFKYLNRQQLSTFDDFKKRIKTLQSDQLRDKHLISSLENQINDLSQKLGLDDSDNVSNINP